jgi:hypothetical protein
MDDAVAERIATSLKRIADALEHLVPVADAIHEAMENGLGIPVAIYTDGDENPLLVKVAAAADD